MVRVIAFLIIVFFHAIAHATTYYVATTGSDSNTGLSESDPYLTMQKCVDVMVAGDTCYVRGGTYSAVGVRFRVSGATGQPITLAAYPNELPILSCTSNTLEANAILIRANAGLTNPIGWITVDGLKVQNCYIGVRGENVHNSIFTHLHLTNNITQGMLISGAHDNIVSYSIINHNGDFTCTSNCTFRHGLYMSGKRWQVHHNVIYDNIAYGITMNGSSSANSSATIPDPAFRGAQDWVVSDNTFGYNKWRAGIVVWGSTCTNFRIENNIFYENGVVLSPGSANGVDFVSATSVTGGSIRNNHFYASGSGAQASVGSAPPSSYTNSGNVVNVSAPAFVDGGSNSLPASPDFRLTASAPVNIARVNEYTNNSTLVVGPYKTVGTGTASITANKITLILPMSTAVPVQNLSTAGVSVSCTSNVCPGSPAVSSVSLAVGTDSQIEILLSGITSNACVSHADPVTVSLASGTWTTNDNIGPYPGTHNKIFNFTSLAVTNQCTGSGPTGYPAGYQLYYKFDEGTGTTANDESANNLDCTLVGATWGAGKSGTGMVVTAGTSQHCTILWGSGVNPTTQSITVFVPVNIASGAENAVHYVVGPDHGTNQRLYICARDGTWRVSIQATTCSATAASNLAVTSGWNELTLILNSATDTYILYKGTTAGTGGATGSYTSFIFATNWKLGQVSSLTSTGGTYDEFLIYLSVQNPADLVAAFNTEPAAPGGTLTQEAIQFQGVILDASRAPIVIGPSVQTIEVPAGGGAVILFQVHCENISDCDLTSFKLVYALSTTPSTYQQVPNTETVDGTWMWGVTTEPNQNTGARSTRLTGSCTVADGSTQVTADQIPSVDLIQDGCVVLAYIVRVGSSTAGTTFEYRLLTESGLELAGGYDQIARIKVVNPMASGIGF